MAAADETLVPSAASASIWRVREFWTVFVASVSFELGGQLYRLALPLIVFAMTQTAVGVNTVGAILFLPNVLFAFVVGAVVDCVSKRALLMTSLAGQILAVLAMFFVLYVPGNHLWAVYALTFTLALFSYAYSNGQNVVVKYVVPQALLTSAVSALTVVLTTLAVAGPALSGIILSLSDYRYGLLLSGASFAVTAIVLLPLRTPAPEHRFGAARLVERVRAGWAAFRANVPLQWISAGTAIFNMAAGIYGIDVIVYMKGTLHLSASTIGIVLSIGGVGGVIGSLLVKRARAALGLGWLIALSAIGTAFAFAALALVTTVPALIAVEFCVGFFSTLSTVCIWAYRQETTPADVMGVVAGVTGSIFKIGMPLAIYGAGWLVEATQISVAFWCSAALSLLFGAVFVAHPLLRRQR